MAEGDEQCQTAALTLTLTLLIGDEQCQTAAAVQRNGIGLAFSTRQQGCRRATTQFFAGGWECAGQGCECKGRGWEGVRRAWLGVQRAGLGSMTACMDPWAPTRAISPLEASFGGRKKAGTK